MPLKFESTGISLSNNFKGRMHMLEIEKDGLVCFLAIKGNAAEVKTNQNVPQIT